MRRNQVMCDGRNDNQHSFQSSQEMSCTNTLLRWSARVLEVIRSIGISDVALYITSGKRTLVFCSAIVKTIEWTFVPRYNVQSSFAEAV